MTKIVRPDMPEPRAITLKVPDLWRIQSQCGVFLEYPFDAGFERHFFNFDRIVFSTERDPAVLSGLIPVEDIYPSQKSDLEVLLDQFFMLERSMEGSRVFEDMVQAGRVSHVRAEGVPHGIEVECFGHAGLPIHESWEASRLTDWMLPESEDWQPMSGASKVSVHYPHRGSSLEKIQIMQRYILEAIASDPSLRSCPIKWTLHDINANTSRIVRAMELVWDGLRRWPYGSGEIAQALATVIEYGTLVTFNPRALYDKELAVALAEQCFGDVIEVEIAMEDGSYTRGCCNTEVLRRAVRDDFLDFLKGDWQTKIDNIYHTLQIAPDLKRVFVFDRLKSVFSTQIVPTQAVLRNEESGKARLYNPARATRVGLP